MVRLILDQCHIANYCQWSSTRLQIHMMVQIRQMAIWLLGVWQNKLFRAMSSMLKLSGVPFSVMLTGFQDVPKWRWQRAASQHPPSYEAPWG